MKKLHKLPKEVKDQIIDRVRNEGRPVSEIAKEHGVKPTTIYSWLQRKTESPQTYRELIKLKKEKQLLLEIIGKMTVQLSNNEKKQA
jgi:transposase-like protein